jgi:hypothetical protein
MPRGEGRENVDSHAATAAMNNFAKQNYECRVAGFDLEIVSNRGLKSVSPEHHKAST